MGGTCNAPRCCFITTGVLGAILAVAGVAFIHYFPIIFQSIVKEQTVLANNSTGFQEWANPPSPIFFEIYVWNLENPKEVAAGAKPNITQKGPYTYREERPKVNITEHSGNGTVSYISPQTFYFDRERSVGDPRVDTFTTLDMPLLTVINEIRFMSGAIKGIIDFLSFFVRPKIYGTFTVHDFIWGYNSTLLEALQKLEPSLVPTHIFGIFAGKNGSNDGLYTVFTGQTNWSLTNTIDLWKGSDTLPYWATPQANMINGTDGTYNHPFVNRNDSLYVFSSDICRSIFAVYLEDCNTRGIPTYRFSPPPYLFANHTVYPPNIGFCTPNGTHCYPGGLLNVSSCQFGAPIFMSSPHFLYADQSVLDMVNGVHPVEELHRTFFDVEPNTGGPLNVSKKLQVNAHLRSYDFAKWYKDVPEAYLPLVWINERGALTQESADQLRKQLLLPLEIGTYGTWAVLGLGCLLVFLCLTCFAVVLCRSHGKSSLSINSGDREPLLNGGSVTNDYVAT
ncbi:lysosome membrane protein 2-like [Diadema setosum]|uniref:lysosome membrane protein 2-like n=1 Tax=Diadema setosum TaxID=31175 RepID=UPI003B3B678B